MFLRFYNIIWNDVLDFAYLFINFLKQIYNQNIIFFTIFLYRLLKFSKDNSIQHIISVEEYPFPHFRLLEEFTIHLPPPIQNEKHSLPPAVSYFTILHKFMVDEN